MRQVSSQVATVILAGGQGKRLHPLTIHHCKPGISYGGRYRLIDIPISNSINSNFRQIFVIAQYLSGELQHHIHQAYRFDIFNPGSIDVLTPQLNQKGEKQWFDGTADAVRKNLDILLRSSADYFLILSGDQLYNLDFQKLIQFAQSCDADLTIASLPVEREDAKRMGLLRVNEAKMVQDFFEKPQEEELLDRFHLGEGKYLASMGMYVFKRDALVTLLEQDQRPDFGFHLINTALKTMKLASYIHEGYWKDIGTIASYYEANMLLTQAGSGLRLNDEKNPIYTRPTFLPGPRIHGTIIERSVICEGSEIEAAEIFDSVIGLRSHVGAGTRISKIVMLGNHFYMPPTLETRPVAHEFRVGRDCVLQKAIIDEHVHIGNKVKLINKDNLETYDGKELYVRDGVIIVPAGASLPDHFEF